MTDTLYTLGFITLIVLLSMNLGVFALYAHTIMPGLKKVTDATFVRAFQAIDRAIINPLFMLQFFMPLALYAGLLLYISNSHVLASINNLIIGLVCYFGAVLVTIAVNVPLNDSIKSVPDSANNAALADAHRAFNESKWRAANTARSVLTLLAIIVTLLA